MQPVRYMPIGIVHSPLKDVSGAPLQSVSAKHIEGTVEVFPEYAPGLKDIEGFSHLILLYHFHLSRGALLTVKPYLDSQEHGIFATRAPVRPNPIGFSIVRLLSLRGRTLRVKELDILDGTPLLDIKPYIPQFDVRRVRSIGWYRRRIRELNQTISDRRFTKLTKFV